ncbi:uroporphyrinogen decarboxylase [Zhouia spongiae]|uniref:Uroporphyrinogen decarboxylase n=1 Tax=Zhouia spongiae TaxID=2202721 RepID=A0ABY3YI13_9FLAO|nr:uroporphyrinogen decarboxylase [Zhouia spongiae]UNY97258.1 uroporphyrinogen decarboxylase [Zhouia spongiae]
MDISGIPFTEWVGYAASLGVLLSFLMKNIVTLRTVNMIGCALFVAYGFMLQTSWPIIVTNLAIFVVNGFYLLKLKKKSNS